MKDQGLDRLGRQLFSLQDGGPQLERFPRFKLRNDTTAAIAAIE